MDILKPELMWIEGRCYRLNFQDSSFKEEEDGRLLYDGFGEESMLSARLKRVKVFVLLSVHCY
jgi:hypothetical protein